MISYLDIKVNAAHPNISLAPFYAFQSSPSNVRILNVPPRIGKWNINAVAVVITLPDNSATTVPAVNVAGCWVATLPGSDVTGYCAAGLQVTASGIDENGAAVDGYCLGIGDVTVLGRDAAIAADGKRYYLHLLDAVPEVPQEGDTCVINGTLKYYDGMNWQPFAPPVSEALAGETLSTKTLADIRTSIGVIGRALGATVAALAIAALPVFGASVESAALNSLDLDANPQVVTNVNLSGLVGDSTLSNYVTRAELDAGWWSEWTILRNGVNITAQVEQPEWVPQINLWDFQNTILEDDWFYFIVKSIRGSEDDTDLTLNTSISPPEPISYTATRHRVAAPVPTKPSDIGAADTNTVAALSANLSTNYYTRAETDDAIDALAAYYITANAAGDAFATVAALTNATAYYSGGALRTPTRNDYAVVLADETHGGAEWRYIYAVHEGATTGQWEAQYPIETNDYDALANKPSIDGIVLSGNKTSADIGLQQLLNFDSTPEVGSLNPVTSDGIKKALDAEAQNATNAADYAVASADTSYPRFTSATNLNQSVQYLTSAPNNVLTIELPTGSAATKDWIVYAYFGVETPLVLPTAIWWMADEAYTNAIPASTPTAFYFSQVADGIYTISRQELKSVEIVAP